MSTAAQARNEYTVHCQWDDEAGVWYVDDTNVPGLSTEADTFEQLERKLAVMIPELLELNVPNVPHGRVRFKLIAQKDALAQSA